MWEKTCMPKYFDQNKNKYVNLSLDRIHKCCTNQCKYVDKKCRAYCQQPHAPTHCQKHCHYNHQSCLAGCDITHILEGSQANIPWCISQSACKGLEREKLRDCLEHEREHIIRCCRQDCIPTREINCDKHCEYSFERALGRDDSDIIEGYTLGYTSRESILLIGLSISLLFGFFLASLPRK